MKMNEKELGTIGGKPITAELLRELTERCEKDWAEDEVTVVPTDYGRALAALRALDLPTEEIEALERRAQHEQKPLSFYLRSVLQNELAS